MAYSPPTENAILQKIDNGLELAVRDLGLDWKDRKSTKRVKYAYIAVRSFTDPDDDLITYSWFQYGASVVAAAPMSPGRPMYTHAASDTDIFHATAKDFARFFKHELDHLQLKDYWTESLNTFLEEFYEIYSPDPYRDVYLENINFRRKIEELQNSISANQPINQGDYEELGRIIARLHQAIDSCEDDNEAVLRDEFDLFVTYTDLLEDVVLMLSKKSAEDIEDDDLVAITELKSFYRNTAWKLLTSIISKKTATGPNAGTLQSWADGPQEEALENFRPDLQEVKGICREQGLLPSFGSYPTYDDELDAKIDELIAIADSSRD